jgi:hypothetical protein
MIDKRIENSTEIISLLMVNRQRELIICNLRDFDV